MEPMEYIESYFQQSLTAEEKRNFERRCEEDESFAQEVAFYVSARQVLKSELLQRKQAQWKEKTYNEEALISTVPLKKIFHIKRWIYAAAACIILALSIYLFEQPRVTQQIAKAYINENYAVLSHTMGRDKDSIELGIEAYDNANFDKALSFFEGVAKKDPGNSYAKQYAGLVYLRTENYDKAIEQFDALAGMHLFSNPGIFLKAIALMERNNDGDKETAKILLQRVAKENLEGAKQATEWLKKM